MAAHTDDDTDPPIDWLRGGGELGEMIRRHDWASTFPGPISSWSRGLISILSTLINSAAPMLLFWGEERVCFYNDAYRPVLGTAKHPRALGGRRFEVELAGDSVAAIAAANRCAPGVAIIDIRLPDMSGFDVAARLRTLSGGATIRCVALSGSELDTDEFAGSVFEHRFLKPVEFAQLVTLLA